MKSNYIKYFFIVKDSGQERLSRALIFVVSALLMCACSNKELCYDHNHTGIPSDLTVAYDWSRALGASPAAMRVRLWPAATTGAVTIDFSGSQGGKATVLSDTYQGLTYNTDAPVRFDGEDWDTHRIYTDAASLPEGNYEINEVFTRSEAPRAKGTETQAVVAAPGEVFAARVPVVPVRASESNTVVFEPLLVTETYRFSVSIKGEASDVASVSASLSGLAGSYYPGSGTVSTDEVIIPFAMSVDVATGRLIGSVTSFGHCQDGTHNHYLTIYVTLKDGSRIYFVFDISDPMHQPDFTGLDDLVIDLTKEEPEPGPEPGPEPEPESEPIDGFSGAVTDWREGTVISGTANMYK